MSFWSEHPVYTRHLGACACDMCAARRLVYAAARVCKVHADHLTSPDRHEEVVRARDLVVYLLRTGAAGMAMPRSTVAILLYREPATVARSLAKVEQLVGAGDGAVVATLEAIRAEYRRLVERDALAAGGY